MGINHFNLSFAERKVATVQKAMRISPSVNP